MPLKETAHTYKLRLNWKEIAMQTTAIVNQKDGVGKSDRDARMAVTGWAVTDIVVDDGASHCREGIKLSALTSIKKGTIFM